MILPDLEVSYIYTKDSTTGEPVPNDFLLNEYKKTFEKGKADLQRFSEKLYRLYSIDGAGTFINFLTENPNILAKTDIDLSKITIEEKYFRYEPMKAKLLYQRENCTLNPDVDIYSRYTFYYNLTPEDYTKFASQSEIFKEAIKDFDELKLLELFGKEK